MRHPVLVARICSYCPATHLLGWRVWLAPGPWFALSHGICDEADERMGEAARRHDERLLARRELI